MYESTYGNTFEVATAVAEGIRRVMPVDVVEVGHVQPAEKLGLVDLLVVGAPTHAFGLSRPATRAEAARRSGRSVVSLERGMREWLDQAWPLTVPATAFDTHTVDPNLPGHAGRALDRRLRSLGCRLLARSESFQVHGYEGPLCDGELDRARAWGAHVAGLATRAGIPV